MGEFADSIRLKAAEALATLFQQKPPHGTDPVLELIAALLEDGSGGVIPLASTSVTTEQWMTWNRMVLEHPRAVTRMITRELEQERPALPADLEAMRAWAARLLLATLDRMGML